MSQHSSWKDVLETMQRRVDDGSFYQVRVGDVRSRFYTHGEVIELAKRRIAKGDVEVKVADDLR